jgi:hypothetical protein
MVQQVHHKVRFGFFITLLAVFLLPLAVSAQSLGGLGDLSGEAFSVSASPQYPSPFSQSTLSFLSSALDLTNSTLAVSVGGKEIYRGAVRPVSVPLGKAGNITTARVTISSGGASYSKTISIQPQDVVLVAEPISSSPPLYPGKSLVPIDGDVRIVAIASLRGTSGNSASPSTYSYSWTVDGARIANSSGIGKSVIIVVSPLQYRSRDVSVVVTSANGNLVSGASLSLYAMSPSVRIYENNPLLGIRYDRALFGSYSITGSESTLYAAAFSLPTTGGVPFVQWFLNGASAQTGNLITLRPTGSGRGEASLSVTATSGNSTPATLSLSLIFGAASGTNLFGL